MHPGPLPDPVCPDFGLMPITTYSDGTYQPAEDGRKAIVMGVDDAHGEITDAVAWYRDHPGRWWLRYKRAIMLGEEMIWRGDTVLLVETPDAWVSARGKAVCVLDWSVPASLYAVLSCAPTIDCATEAVGQKLEAVLRLPRLNLRTRGKNAA